MSRVEVRGIPPERALYSRAVKRMHAALRLLGVTPVTAQVNFFDENGPKGGLAIRCALTVRLPYRPAVRVEHVAESPRLAFDGGFTKLERQLEEYREQHRDSQRHPKKYFVAKRLVEPWPPSQGAREARPKGSRARKGAGS
jgi:ribosome-associated translation inhibitor RaiA